MSDGAPAAGSLRDLARPYAARAIFVLVLLGLTSFLGAAYPYFSGRLIDAVVQRDARLALANGGALTLAIIAAALVWTVNRRGVVRLAADFAHGVRRRVFAKLAEADLATVAAVSDARARTRVDSDVKALIDSVDLFLVPVAAALIQLTVLLVAVALISLPMFVALLVSIVPLFLLTRFDTRATRQAAEQAGGAGDRFAASVATYLSYGGILRARAFGRTAQDRTEFEAGSLALRDAAARVQERGAVRVLVVHSVSALVTFAILAVGIGLVVNGQVSVGALVAFITYQQMISEPITGLARAPQQLASLRVTARRIGQLLALPDPPNGDYHPAGHSITLRDVTYRYPDGTVGIAHVSLEIRRGERVAIVGPSGSGKSTLALVIQGLYVPQEGEVCYDGVPAQRCDRASVRALFAYDAASTAFVPGTVRQNIRYAAPDDDPARCAAAARDAQAAEFIEATPNGYDTRLDDGEHGFSTGQMRRLGIARALAAGRPFLVLDEPTGPLDPQIGSALFERLGSVAEGAIVATHDLAELERFDRILVMADNTIARDTQPVAVSAS